MNILQCIPEFGLAGAEIMCENLIYQLLEKKNDNVYVLSLYDYHSAITERLERKGVKIIYLHKKKGFDISAFWKIYKVLKEKNIDVIHTHRYLLTYALPASITAHVKVRVHTVHNIARGEVSKWRRFIHNIYFNKFNVTPVAISPLVKNSMLQEYSLDEGKVPIIFNGIDLSKCKPKKTYKYNDEFKIIHVGRLNKVKNQSLLIEAVYRIYKKGYNIRLDLWGEGEEKDNYQIMINERGLQDVVFLRGLTDDVYTQMNLSDTLALPSLYEGMPITLIEAMKTGLPIIASNVGGIPDMIEDNVSGIIIDPQIDALENAICRIIDSEELRESLGAKAFKKANEFSSKEMCNSYYSLYVMKYGNTVS